MSGRAPEKAIVMRCTGKALVPTDRLSEEAMEKAKGKTMLVFTERPRNPKHHAKMMAMLNVVVNNQDTFPSIEKLLTYIKLRIGHTDSYIVDGKTVVVPRSISFASLSQDDFEQFYERAVDVILTEVVPPGLRRSALRKEIEGFLEPRNAPPPDEERSHD